MEPIVYIIDDDLVSQFATRYRVEQSNNPCTVVSCDSAESGLKMYIDRVRERKGIPDIILLDLVMPNMDGWKFLEEFSTVRDRPKRTDIYILSAFTNSKDRKRVKEHPFVKGYFDKPLSKNNVDSIFVQKED